MAHDFTARYFVNKSWSKLERHVINRRLLGAYENLEIIKCENLMKNEGDPILSSCLYSLLK